MFYLRKKIIALILLAFCLEGCHSQPSKQGVPLHLINTIDLPGVSGRIDHLIFDSARQRVFIAALGNNSVEVVDLKTNRVIHSLQHLNEPQGIAFIAGKNLLFVANGGNGACDVFNTDNYAKIASIHLAGDADNVRYDAVKNTVYVGYGAGGIAIIDVATLQQVADVKLQGHPESFQLDESTNRLFVNVPDRQQIEIVDLQQRTVIDRLHLTAAKSNFPMAFDRFNHRLFIGCRHPAKLLILDSDTGKQLSEIETDTDTDDIFYNQQENSVYMSCGGGYLNIIQQQQANKYILSQKISTRSGARTSFFIPSINCLLVAFPATFNHRAGLLVYEIKK